MNGRKKKNEIDDGDIFPDYTPKTTPDTISDYLKADHEVIKILKDIEPMNKENFKKILNSFKKFSKKADAHPGNYEKGNPILGADPNQYIPSNEELITSELGKWLLNFLSSIDESTFEKLKENQNIKSERLEFHKINFWHADVMGSGRYFYAEKDKNKTLLIF